MEHVEQVPPATLLSIQDGQDKEVSYQYASPPSVNLLPFFVPFVLSRFYELSIRSLSIASIGTALTVESIRFYIDTAQKLFEQQQMLQLFQILQESSERQLAAFRSVREKERKWRKEQELKDREWQRLQQEIRKLEVYAQNLRRNIVQSH